MPTNHSLADYLPRDVIKEIENLEPFSKSLLLFDLAEEILESTNGLFELNLSATTLQNLKAITALTMLILSTILSAYSQDPRSCSDPRTQYPSNPPCQKQSSDKVEEELRYRNHV